MDLSVIVERTKDIELINSIMFNDDIFDVISEDRVTKENQRFDVYGECWLKVLCDETLIGLYNFHYINQSTLEAHVHILPEFRKAHSAESIIKIYQWIIDECDGAVSKFVCNIPSLYPNVLSFCLSNGFTLEGTNRKSHLKNGILHDINMVGITKKEIIEVLR